MAKIETTEMLTTAEAAARLGDGTLAETIQKYCSRGIIKAIKLGHSWLIPIVEFERFRKNRRGPGRPSN